MKWRYSDHESRFANRTILDSSRNPPWISNWLSQCKEMPGRRHSCRLSEILLIRLWESIRGRNSRRILGSHSNIRQICQSSRNRCRIWNCNGQKINKESRRIYKESRRICKESRRILKNLDESWRISTNLEESSTNLRESSKNLGESSKNINEYSRILKNFDDSFKNLDEFFKN